jgi:glycine/D-amino acid oxidase-like deaminating enzyme
MDGVVTGMQDIGTFDVAVIGGGAVGSATALNLARNGMKTVLIERRGLCMEASGVNAGTLTHHTGSHKMNKYYQRGIALWKSSPEWLGFDAGFRERGGLTLAFNEDEAKSIEEALHHYQEQGCEIELVGGNRAREIDPNLSHRAIAALYFPRDGYANSNRTGFGFHKALTASGATVMTRTEVTGIEREANGFTILTNGERIRARRLVIAAGAWVRRVAALFDLEFTQTVSVRVNMMTVTERMPRLFKSIFSHAKGGLSLKQPDNGTVLIGGGWQGIGNPQIGGVEVVRQNFVSNLRLAHSVIPGLENARIVRTWLGIEARMADSIPLAGHLPGVEGAYVIGCFTSGWTAGPYLGKLMAAFVMDREPELPLFDPARVIRKRIATAA